MKVQVEKEGDHKDCGRALDLIVWMQKAGGDGAEEKQTSQEAVDGSPKLCWWSSWHVVSL